MSFGPDNHAAIKKEYPLIEAVARASFVRCPMMQLRHAFLTHNLQKVERHHPVVVKLEYTPEGATSSLFFAGKGITYDTGGADVKTGGHMSGMSRDKV